MISRLQETANKSLCWSRPRLSRSLISLVELDEESIKILCICIRIAGLDCWNWKPKNVKNIKKAEKLQPEYYALGGLDKSLENRRQLEKTT